MLVRDPSLPLKCANCGAPMQWHSDQRLDPPRDKYPVQVFECTGWGQLRAVEKRG
jgi:hypothetical protein